jgi:hypothetical protein
MRTSKIQIQSLTNYINIEELQLLRTTEYNSGCPLSELIYHLGFLVCCISNLK